MRAAQTWCEDKRAFVDKRARRKRCQHCGKLVWTHRVFDMDGELVGYKIPDHKTKPRTYKRPKGDRRGRQV